MVKIRNVPRRAAGAPVAPARMRFRKTDRIILADGIDWRWKEDNDYGHVLQAAHDKKIKRGLTHLEMRVEASAITFRHDRGWYSTTQIKTRLKADVSEMNDLSFPQRQKIMWKEEMLLVFERLELEEPETVSRGDKLLPTALERVDEIVRGKTSTISDNGRRRYGGRLKMFFDRPGSKAFLTWMKFYIESDRDPLSLRDGHSKSGNFEERLDDDQLRYLRVWVRKCLARNKPSRLSVWAKMKAQIENVDNPGREAAGLPPVKVPSYGRFRQEWLDLDHFERIAGTEGIERAVRKCQAYGDGVTDVERALEEVEIDHWTVNLRTILRRAGVWPRLNRTSRRQLEKVRMVLGAAVCRRTDCIVGMTLSRTASVEAALRLIEMVVSDKTRFANAAGCITPYDILGIPELILFDGGPAFNNGEMRAVLRDLGVDFFITPGGLPHLRGKVERMFKTIDDQAVSWFEGKTFRNIVDKADYDPDERAGNTVEELGRVLIRFAVDRHHNKPRRHLGGDTPREAYLRTTKAVGVYAGPDATKLRNVCGINIKRVVTPGGIRFLGIQYRSKTLHDHFLKFGGKQLICRVHPANLGAISVRIGKRWLTVPGPSEFDGIDAEAWIAAEAAIRMKMKTTEMTITGRVINQAILDAEDIAEIGRKRAGIEDHPLARKALLAAEAKMRVFANFPEDRNDAAVRPSTAIYETAVKVAGAAAVGGESQGATSADAPGTTASRTRRPAKTPSRKPSKTRPTSASRKPAAKTRRPGLKRRFSAKD